MTKKSVTRKYSLPGYENFDLTILEDDREFADILAELDKEGADYKQRLEEEKNKQEELKEPFGDRKGPRPTGFPKVPKTVPF